MTNLKSHVDMEFESQVLVIIANLQAILGYLCNQLCTYTHYLGRQFHIALDLPSRSYVFAVSPCMTIKLSFLRTCDMLACCCTFAMIFA